MAMGNFIRSISSLIGGSSGAAASGMSEATPLPSAQAKADEPQAPQSQQQALPLVPYAVRAESMPQSTPQRSRSVSLLRRTHPANATTHAMPTLHPHPTGPVLTQTERVRLQVMQAQIQLTSLRLYDGPIDGMMTLATATAVRYFQTLKGQRPSGVLTAGTLAALGIAPTP
jgi:hypothetical protein